MSSKYEELERITRLKQNGVITEEEFEIERKNIQKREESKEQNKQTFKTLIIVAVIIGVMLLIAMTISGNINKYY